MDTITNHIFTNNIFHTKYISAVKRQAGYKRVKNEEIF